jgi:hypothetical protein
MSQTPSSQHVQWSRSNQSSDEGDYAAASPPPPPSNPPVSHHQQASGTRQYRSAKQQQEEEEEEDIDNIPTGGSLTTQPLQKWLKQRKFKAEKSKSNP